MLIQSITPADLAVATDQVISFLALGLSPLVFASGVFIAGFVGRK